MQEQKYDELRDRSTDALEKLFDHERVLAQQVIRSQVDQMLASGEALTLTDEEERMLRSFRRFKLSCKPGAVFKWQTRPEEGVLVSQETGLVRDPQEVSE